MIEYSGRIPSKQPVHRKAIPGRCYRCKWYGVEYHLLERVGSDKLIIVITTRETFGIFVQQKIANGA
jgi:hypothetical protein